MELMRIVRFTIGGKRFKKGLKRGCDLMESSVESCFTELIGHISLFFESAPCLMLIATEEVCGN